MNKTQNPHIFLDIDGVISIENKFCNNLNNNHPIYNIYPFDPKCVKVLNEIIEAVDPVIILSSDWKNHFPLKVMNELFKWNGLNCSISDYTKCLWGETHTKINKQGETETVKFQSLTQLAECRAAEILDYVNEHDIDNYVAVDDLNLTPYIGDFVWCRNFREGIKQLGLKEKIINKLKQ